MIELLKILPLLALGTAICIFSSAWVLMWLGVFSEQEAEDVVQPEVLAAPSALDIKVIFLDEQTKDYMVIAQPAKTEIIEYKFSVDENAYQQFPASDSQPIELTEFGEPNEFVMHQRGKMTRYLQANFLIPEKTHFDNFKDSRALLAA